MIFFFYGPNTYEARRQIAKMTDQYQKKTGGDLGLESIDGTKTSFGELRASLQAAPFLASSRLVIIEKLNANKPVAAKIEELLSDIPSSTVAVFYDPDVDQRTTYFKALKASARTVQFQQLPQPKLQQWIEREVASLDGEIERPAINRLLELAGDNQWHLSNEIAKLINYRSKISVEMVDDMVESSQVESIFDLVEAMTTGKQAKAFELYNRLRRDGQSEMYILSMIIWQFRNLLAAKSAGKITAPVLAKSVGMSPYVAGKMLTRRHLFSEDQLKEAFVKAVDTDYRIKSGSGSGEVLVEQLVLSLADQMVRS